MNDPAQTTAHWSTSTMLRVSAEADLQTDIGYGGKPWLVASNNARNHALSDVIAIRLTTTACELPTWVHIVGLSSRAVISVGWNLDATHKPMI